jgi:hypothetical protein
MRPRLQIAGKKRRSSMRLPCLLHVSDLLLSAYTQRDLLWLLEFGDRWLSWRASSAYLWCWSRGTCRVSSMLHVLRALHPHMDRPVLTWHNTYV